MKSYDHKKIEKKWQKEWDKKKIYKTNNPTTSSKRFRKKMYVLDMFPYPSGEGLHVGHPRGYLATDVYSRMKRMDGYNVLHPMGWDAFGLPAENYAIKNKIHPKEAVKKNIARYKKQLSILGVDYDWNHEIDTTDPKFYKWTQWIFLQMYKKGLAFESFEPINWCPSCQTGLANEDVESDGTCERCDSVVEQKPMRQWVLKITDYADRMLEDLDKLPKWPEGVKEAQRNWIGKSEGAEIEFKIKGINEKVKVFTTRADTIFGATYVVLAPEHELVNKLKPQIQNWKDVEKYIKKSKNKDITDRTAEGKEKTGVELKGLQAINPASGEEVPVWIADYVLATYGTGAIMAVPAHDERDRDFAIKYNLPITDEPFVDAEKITKKVDGKMVSKYKLRDWVFSRQRYWGEPIPIIHCKDCGAVPVPEKDLPVILPKVKSYKPTGTGESPLAGIAKWVNVKCPKCKGKAKRETNTMPQWAGSSWYYLRYIDPKNNKSLIDLKKEKKWMPVDVYVGGDHATRHLIYARFWHKFLYDIGVVSTPEPFPRLEFLGFILAPDGRKMSKRWKNVVNPDDMVNQFGADAFRLYEMFIGPFESTAPWNTNGIVGTYRFLEKVWNLSQKLSPKSSETKVRNLLHKTIKKISFDIENFKFNTAVSSLMIFVNEATKEGLSEKDFKIFLKILAPFAPHITDELSTVMGEKESVHLSQWPKWNEKFLKEETVKIAVAVNGKVRGEIMIGVDMDEEKIKTQALAEKNVTKFMDGNKPKKVIYVKNRLINIVL